MTDTARQAWRQWWDEEGSAMRPLPNEDTEQFARRMTEIAWSNGAFKRLADVDLLRAELVAMRQQRDEAVQVLREIAHQDYRGHPSTESQIAMNALAAMRKGVARE